MNATPQSTHHKKESTDTQNSKNTVLVIASSSLLSFFNTVKTLPSSSAFTSSGHRFRLVETSSPAQSKLHGHILFFVITLIIIIIISDFIKLHSVLGGRVRGESQGIGGSITTWTGKIKISTAIINKKQTRESMNKVNKMATSVVALLLPVNLL